ncbi:hypothetical protein PR048_028449 [Dryococelus australis]|uniref:Uncharacterized protein n=1 Tax=Dryococelus australis TaxID=614101 RepID=A0ABQ9GED4_9NEOP|nr:hypothetical protein PR048_028449 [Dryococelus australis]
MSEMLSQYCNKHTPVCANMPQPEKNGKPPVLKFQNYHNINKVPIVVQTCKLPTPIGTKSNYGIYINCILPAHKTSSLPTNEKFYTGEYAPKHLINEGEVLKALYGGNMILFSTDTDSFVKEIAGPDFYRDLASDFTLMSELDTSAYPPTHP